MKESTQMILTLDKRENDKVNRLSKQLEISKMNAVKQMIDSFDIQEEVKKDGGELKGT